MGTINKVFLHNGDPQNGATAQLWKITAFAAYTDSTATVQDNPLAATSVECLTSDGTQFAVGDVVRMGTEYCLIWAISVNTIYIIRAHHGSTAAAHVQNTVIYDEAITPPVEDDAVPGAGQQGGDITTGVAYGGDGAYRFDAVPEMEYYASVTYDGHITYSHCFVERNDITPEQILTADGDVLIRDATTVTRLPKGNASDLLQMGANRPSWVASGGFVATREFFIPVTQGKSAGIDAQLFYIGDFPAAVLTALNDFAHIAFKVPHDFTAITNAEIIVSPAVTDGAANWDIDSDYGAVGEQYNAHSEADAASTYNVVAGQLFAVDVSGILSALAASDYVGLKLLLADAGDDVNVLGIRFKYT